MNRRGRHFLVTPFFAGLVLAMLLMPHGQASVGDVGDHDGRLIVRFRADATEAERAWTRSRASCRQAGVFRHLGLEVLSAGPGVTARQALLILRNEMSVEYAEPDARAQPLGMPRTVPPDADFDQQWYLDAAPLQGYVGIPSNSVMIDFDIDAPEGWAVLGSAYAGGLRAAVGVLDSGCGELGYFDDAVGYVPNHQDLPNASLFANTAELTVIGADSPADPNSLVDDVNGWDWVDDDNVPDDAYDAAAPYHGTAISGIISAAWGGAGMAGIGQDRVTVLPLKSSYLSEILAGIDYTIQLAAAGRPARVLNASWKFGYDPLSLRDAVIAARDAGVAVVAAAGNDMDTNDDDLGRVFPAEYTRDPTLSNVLAVSATADGISPIGLSVPGGHLAFFSNFGPSSVQIAAPGENIHTTAGGSSGYQDPDGTSFSAPIAAAVLAHLMVVHPELSPSEAIDRLVEGGDFDARLAGLIRSGRRVNLAGALAPFHPYSGFAYLDSPVGLSMYADTVSAKYGSITGARLHPSLSTVNQAAVMASPGGAWAVSPLAPGIATFVLSFGGAAAPVGSYETGPWRITAIYPFTAQVRPEGTLDFSCLLPNPSGTVSWSLVGADPPDVGTIDEESGTFTAVTSGRARVALHVDGDAVDNSGWILVTPLAPPTNMAPKVTIDSGPMGVTTDTGVTFTWTGSDPDGAVENYWYSLDSPADPDVWTTATSVRFDGLDLGDHVFSVKAIDDDGTYSQVESAAFTVNDPPEVAITSGPDPVVTDAAVTFELAGQDTLGGVRSLLWSFDDPAPSGSEASSSAVVQAGGLACGEHVFYAWAVDHYETLSSPAVWSFRINCPPTVTIVSGPASSVHASTVAYQWTGDDPDGTVVGYYCSLDDPDHLIGTTETAWTFTGLSLGPHTFYLRAEDDLGILSSTVTDAFTVTEESTGTGGGGGGGCFIATAACGSYDHPMVVVLRRFRDEVLLAGKAGRAFVDGYYRYSPPAARWLEAHGWAKPVVQALLLPAVLLAWISLNPAWGLGALFLLSVAWSLARPCPPREAPAGRRWS